ncbi:c-type cytochrome domain-containing protein [Chitinophaga qingshengii]|uniref:Chitobiase/beta-hexosaminidase C-terminal domain-containing protein n=1 Tax=Chitinophaga qingshengii TaxID=1569794 RepID=A0ABR7TXP6_9BACT|nr:c-type cytochrome domain-containing protein [Chitinophaga qingshengii]MBC9934438.1 chitobiase/beta-hexosaminidase C-terminal domain-containing protein [Chitinophaga qingshengii]
MKWNRVGWQDAGNQLLFAVNIFALVLFVAGSRIVAPAWLQVLGRMHPLVLHFPIVLLILGGLLLFVQLREPEANRWKTQFTSVLLLVAALSTAITVIMGLVLAREEGYADGNIQWHKWGGMAVLWAASALYWLRAFPKPWLPKTGSIIAVTLLLVTGHWGAGITHGNNFVLAPVTPHPTAVPLEKALVYEHLVKPVLEEKCMSCHNASKAKGGLSMELPQQLLAGGKGGKLFIPGNPAMSLVMERLHLPAEDKKHMPPTGKPQLTEEEVSLLYYWIKGGADFKTPVVNLPAGDSLRLIAASRLQPAVSKEPRYDFSPADDKLVRQLNNNYRVVYPVALHAAPLVANWYNKDKFNITSVSELLPLKGQLIEMHLQKMPVQDADMEILAQFKQLRVLNLSFTNITGQTLATLTKLPHLQSLSLSGTPVTLQQLTSLKSAPALQELYVWNTGLSPADVQQVQKTLRQVTIVQGFTNEKGEQLKLNQPTILNTTAVFRNSTQLKLQHPVKGVAIRYTIDGSAPDSLQSPVFKDSLLITGNTTVRAIACKQGWYTSDPIQFQLLKTTYTPDSITLVNQPEGSYIASGGSTLTDGQKGGTDHNNGKWLGYTKNILEAVVRFPQPVPLQSVTIGTLCNVGAYIFLPHQIEIWGGSDPRHLKLLKKLNPPTGKKDDPVAAMDINCAFPLTQVSYMKITMTPAILPSWHPGKGKHAWVFADELLFN